MDIREKLVELQLQADIADNISENGTQHREFIADLMIANGVTVQECGQWNDGDPYCPICRKDKFRGLDADVWADWKPDYCPNCGAKMDGGTN